MLTLEPWVLALQAGASSTDQRARLQRDVEEQLGEHCDWTVFSTCHRLEVYGCGAMPLVDIPLKVSPGEDAVRHAMRVAAGLESAIVGEDEILHQVRDALKQARASRLVSGRLQRLFETAIAAGRQARAGRTTSTGNLAQKAVGWLEGRAALAGKHVLVVGAGRMASNLAPPPRLPAGPLTLATPTAPTP